MTIKDGFKFGIGLMLAVVLFQLVNIGLGLLIKVFMLVFGGVAA